MRPRDARGLMYPPTRRELTLLLFSLTVFVLAYNLETSLRLVGVTPAKLGSSYLSTIGLGIKDPGFDPDGRRPKEWRDDVENLIFGEWVWEEGKVAGVESGQVGVGVGDVSIYNVESGKTASRSAGREDRGVGVAKGVTPCEQFVRWGSEVPVAKALAHVPGYTILENLIAVNGTFFLVTDDSDSVPPLDQIGSSALGHRRPPRPEDWQILNKEQAVATIGTFGGRIFGTTWLSLDDAEAQDPYTLFSLFRAQSTLAASSLSSTKSQDASSVPPPLRLIFPYVPTFSSPHIPPPPNVDSKTHPPMRERSYIGIHPLIPKAVLPTLGIWYQEDWQDIVDMNAPWVFDRVVIASRGAADRGRAHWTSRWTPPSNGLFGGIELRRRADGDEADPVWAAPFVGLRAKQGWWTPVRNALLNYLRLPTDQQGAGISSAGSSWGRKKAAKPVITYVSMQEEPRGAGARLYDADHDALIDGLLDLQRSGIVGEFHIVKGNGSVGVHKTEWADRMSAIARSSIVLGPYGFQLADSIFMAPPAWPHREMGSEDDENQSPAPLLMEFFPPGTFTRDQEFAVRSLGMRYVAWWNDRKFTGDSLPPVINPEDALENGERITINPKAILEFVRDEISRKRVP